MIRIFLLGFMGTGKTTLGRALARELDIQFCDLDQYIEQRYMKSITQLFSQFGEEKFRKIEASLLREAGEFENVIISCGGSTPLWYDNMEYMNGQGITIFMDTSIPVLFSRLAVARIARPLIASKNDEELMAYIQSELERRRPGYEKAQYRYSGDRLESREQIADSVTGVRCMLGI